MLQCTAKPKKARNRKKRRSLQRDTLNLDVEVNKWREVSGQNDGNCHIFNTSYTERGGDILGEDNRILGKEGLVIDEVLRRPLPFPSTAVPCTAWEYDTSKFRRTVSSEFDLVCDREVLLSVGQTVFFFGMLCGGPISGVLSDRFGRKPVLVLMILLLSFSGEDLSAQRYLFGFNGNHKRFYLCRITASAAPTYETLLAARFFSALGAVGKEGTIINRAL